MTTPAFALDSVPSRARRLQPSKLLYWLMAAAMVFAYLDLSSGRSDAAEPDPEDPFATSGDPAATSGDPAATSDDPAASSEAGEVPLEMFEGVIDEGPWTVLSSLKWLARHQMPDGGWSFHHIQVPQCRGKCRHPGQLTQARNAATGLALLSFLGAGNTHKHGEFKSQVKAGRDFLIANMKIGPHGGSFHESGGLMYSHGIAALALSEHDAMAEPGPSAQAQQAIDFIVYCQDPVGGGWRYNPRQPGDTSVTGWQLTALKSAQLAGLRVPPDTLKKASLFLDSVQESDGAVYGYTKPGSGPATTAIGLLMRLHLGWKRDHPALQRGVEWLREQGPSKDNMYYNYYATQVMHQVGGEAWRDWSAKIRDHLVESQAREGHKAGSWHFPAGGPGASRGGRLYSTTLALMILEVYYRHLPIYRTGKTKTDSD